MPLEIDKLWGSQARCLWLTGLPRDEAAARLTELANPSGAVVSPAVDIWVPEARVERDRSFLDKDKAQRIQAWWLKYRRGANTPNWDIASTCTIDKVKGLLLIEAKAHNKELSIDGKSPATTDRGKENHKKIGVAIQQANDELEKILPGWSLSRDKHYQLCNRFAWAWKLASLGVPVVLIYLGFLNALEMADKGEPFSSAGQWEDYIRNHARDIVPQGAWNRKLDIGSTPLWFLIRSLELPFKPR